MSSTRQSISKVDTAWLRMETPTNLMMITGVIGLAHTVDFERLVDTVAMRFLSFPRFRHKAVTTTRGSFWELDEDFDILSHVRRAALPGKADKYELQEFVSELASSPLDQSKPLWQFHLVENYVGGPVLVNRIHHCYADGIALIQVLLSLTDPTPEPRPSAKSTHTWKARRVAESNIFKRFMEPAREGIEGAWQLSQKIIEEALGMLRDPDQVSLYAHQASEITEELATALLLSDDPKTRFRGRLGVRKRVAWTPPLPFAEVKAVGKALGCTVNDVLIASAAGALNAYMRSCGDDPAGVEIRATVPVNLRPLEHAKDLGNHFGLVFLNLPVGENNPLKRLLQVHQNMTELKNSKQAAVAFGLLAALGMGPSQLQKPMLEMMSRKASTVLTNVPGPQQSLYIAGTEIAEMMFWVPQNGSIGMGISILSYAGQVYMGMITDRRLVPDPEAITERFQSEFENLLYLALQLPEGDIEPGQVDDWLGNTLIDQPSHTRLSEQLVAAAEHQPEIAPRKRQARRKTAKKPLAQRPAKKVAKQVSKPATKQAAKKAVSKPATSKPSKQAASKAARKTAKQVTKESG